MPEMNGLELMAELNRSLPHVKVIAMSGSLKGEGGLLAAKRLGAHHTFQKPFDLSALLEAVRDELAHEQPQMTPPQIAEAQQLAWEWKPTRP
jgi:DNA-binding NtrC family response regulator